MYNIIKLSDGNQIINLLIEAQFNKPEKIKLIISDENMEFINGSEALRIIEKLQFNGKLTSKPLFVSLTAFDDIATKETILSSGFNDILIKPVSKVVINSLLKQYDLI